MIRLGFRGCLVALVLPLASVGLSGPRALAAPSLAAVHDAGAWDLAFEKGNRRCRLFLRTEAVADGYAIAMPAVCHKAFPALAGVASWSAGTDERLTLSDAGGKALFDFAPGGTAGLTATAGSDTYTMTPVNPALQEVLRAAHVGPASDAPADTGAAGGEATSGVLVEKNGSRPKGAGKATAAARPVLPPTTAAAVAGNYAVLRQDRDTGCMVTLEQAGRSSDLKARLAPACRDQGIVIFDPSGWQLLHGSELVLTAKRGHTTALSRRDDKTWANTPARGAPLVLKRL